MSVCSATCWRPAPPTIWLSRSAGEALAIGLEKRGGGSGGGPGAGLGQVIAFIGSRGGVGVTTTAVSFAWIMSDRHKENTVLLDLDLHFGTIALKPR